VLFLRANLDIFAWKPSDMPGIPRDVAKHKLNIKPSTKPIKQSYGVSAVISAKPSGKRSRSSSCGFHQRRVPPQVASQPCVGKEEEWQVDDVS
jgi:hypothetical protein